MPFDHWSRWWRENHFGVSLFAGAASGLSTEAILFPVDSMKTRLQSPRGFQASGAFRGLYQGIKPALLGSAPASAIFFCTYEASKEALKRRPEEDLSPLKLASASILGELAACIARVPTEFVKQRLQAGHAVSLPQALSDLQIACRCGLFSASFRATVCRDVCFSGLQFPIYEALKSKYSRQDSSSISTIEAALCGSVAGMCSGFLTTPFDKCKTHLMLRGNSSGPLGVFSMLQDIYKQSGIMGLFSGGAARTIWMGLGGLIFLGSYEFCKDVGGIVNQLKANTPSTSSPPLFSSDGRTLMAPEHAPLEASFVAGAIAGMCVDVTLHPGDTIKTRMQAAQGFQAAGGFRGLWHGITPVLLASIPSNSAFFVTYQCMLRSFGRSHAHPSAGLSTVIIEASAATVAEVSAVLIRVPAEVLKQRIQVGRHSSFVGALSHIHSSSGIPGFYVGFRATLMRELPFMVVQMTAFESLKRRHPWANPAEGSINSLAVGTSCGAVAGGLAGAVTTPLDLVKTRIMLADVEQSRGLYAVLRTTFSTGGLTALFCGLIPRTCISAAGGAIWLGTFEGVQSFLAN